MPPSQGLTDRLPSVLLRSSVPHGNEELNDQVLQELGLGGLDALQQFLLDGGPEDRVTRRDGLLRSLAARVVATLRLRRLRCASALAKCLELRVLHQERGVDAFGRRCNHVLSSLRDPEAASSRRRQQGCVAQVGGRPRDTVVDDGLMGVRQRLSTFLRRQVELIGHGLHGCDQDVLGPVPSEPQQRQHDRLEIRDRHWFPPLLLCQRAGPLGRSGWSARMRGAGGGI
jgi:hypothetical protein